MADTEKVQVKLEDGDPQSVQDLTGFVPFHIPHILKSLKTFLLVSVVVFHLQTPNCDCFDFSFFEKIDICMKA